MSKCMRLMASSLLSCQLHTQVLLFETERQELTSSPFEHVCADADMFCAIVARVQTPCWTGTVLHVSCSCDVSSVEPQERSLQSRLDLLLERHAVKSLGLDVVVWGNYVCSTEHVELLCQAPCLETFVMSYGMILLDDVHCMRLNICTSCLRYRHRQCRADKVYCTPVQCNRYAVR